MTSHDNVTDIVERLSYLHVWPQSIGSTYADTLTPRQIERLYDVGNVATEAAEEIISLRKQLENAREALEPSAATKYCYSGEFKQNTTLRDEDGEEYSYPVTIEWTTIKEIMAAINARAIELADRRPHRRTT